MHTFEDLEPLRRQVVRKELAAAAWDIGWAAGVHPGAAALPDGVSDVFAPGERAKVWTEPFPALQPLAGEFYALVSASGGFDLLVGVVADAPGVVCLTTKAPGDDDGQTQTHTHRVGPDLVAPAWLGLYAVALPARKWVSVHAEYEPDDAGAAARGAGLRMVMAALRSELRAHLEPWSALDMAAPREAFEAARWAPWKRDAVAAACAPARWLDWCLPHDEFDADRLTD